MTMKTFAAITILFLLLLLPTTADTMTTLSPLWRCSVSSKYTTAEADDVTSSRAHETARQLCWNGTPPDHCCCLTDWCRRIR